MDPNQPMKKKTSPWLFVGLGCLALVLLVVGGLVITGLYAVNKVKGIAEEMKDPKARTAKANEMLGSKDLPAGYFAQMNLSIPMLMDMVMLSDVPPKPSGEPGDTKAAHQFMYFNIIKQKQDDQSLDDFFSGKSNDTSALRRNNINVDTKDIINRGTFDSNGHPVAWVAQRGHASTTQGGAGSTAEGLVTMVLFRCSSNDRLRMGIWTGEDPHPEAPVKDADFKGTVADENEVKPFVGNFNPCGA